MAAAADEAAHLLDKPGLAPPSSSSVAEALSASASPPQLQPQQQQQQQQRAGDGDGFSLARALNGGGGEKDTSKMKLDGDDEDPAAGSSASPNAPGAAAAASTAESAASVPFWPIAVAITLIFLMHGWLAELVVLAVVENKLRLGWFFALVTVVGQWVPALAKRGWEKSDGPRFEHVIVGVAHCLSLGMSNSGGLLVEFNTFSLFKSAKVVFVMAVSLAFLGVAPSPQEWMWGLGLMVGLLVLTGADEAYSHESLRATSPLMGGLTLTVGVGMSALVSVGQQAALQRRALQPVKPGSWRLVWGPPGSRPVRGGKDVSKDDEREALLFWSSLVSMLLLGPFCAYIGEFHDGVRFFWEVASVRTWLAQATALALVAGGQRLVLVLNGAHGATSTAAVLTLRKVASFVTSVLVYPKPFHLSHGVGLFIVVLSSVFIQRAEYASSLRRAKGQAGSHDKKMEHDMSSSPRNGTKKGVEALP